MFLPTSHISGLVLLVLALVCFALWPSLFKLVGGSWRYELFALDFSFGALVSALVIAYTLGTLGPEMSFTDRLLIAGSASSLFTVGAGAVFALANLLLLGSVNLLGLAAAFPICFGVAALGTVLLRMRTSHTIAAIAGSVLMLIAAAISWNATRAAASSNRRTNAPRGLALAILSGVSFAALQVALLITSDPEFGPGPYATALLFALGLTLATPCFNFFFMNIKIVGGQIRFASYKLGGWKAHAPGLLSGVLWTLGLLALYLAVSVTGLHEISRSWVFAVPALAVPVAALIGLLRWREFGAAPRSRKLLQASVVCFVLGLIAIAVALG